MKTSNKISVLALIIIVLSLVFYDFALKATYKKGDFRSRFYKMKEIKLKDFNTINNKSSNIFNLSIEQGDHFAVWIDEDLPKKLQFDVKNNELTIDYKFEKGKYESYIGKVVIICPKLDRLISGQSYRNDVRKDINNKYSNPDGNTVVSNFIDEALNLQIDPFTTVILKNNKLKNLNAMVGDSTQGRAVLTILNDNIIENSDFKIKGHSFLSLENPKISLAKFNFSDSADVSLKGNSLNLFRGK